MITREDKERLDRANIIHDAMDTLVQSGKLTMDEARTMLTCLVCVANLGDPSCHPRTMSAANNFDYVAAARAMSPPAHLLSDQPPHHPDVR